MNSMVSPSEATRPSGVLIRFKQTALAVLSSLATRMALVAGTVLATGLVLFIGLASVLAGVFRGPDEETPENESLPRPINGGNAMATIMVVDDAEFMRMRCKKLLTQSGYEVMEATNGSQAVEIYKQNRPDAVLLDIAIPDTNGLIALREIRTIDPDARVAMITGMGEQSLVIEALKAGARDFVIRPFDHDRVLTTVRKIVAQ